MFRTQFGVSLIQGEKCYWANSVTEVVTGEGGKVSHSSIQSQSLNAAHFKWTSVRQLSLRWAPLQEAFLQEAGIEQFHPQPSS
ncbi:hypothetical protein LOK49_LG01G01276 [Camellia lanceoleosa]|uniref:Uncharacterized protein n=1 Tax=Camellia lanceoleosa TaxID=1840588 RepID=A0ACC0IW02_9ERIC|nr:hypothetical protein LOK49_LG01G01276 [Camellia lanceoleosa]